MTAFPPAPLQLSSVPRVWREKGAAHNQVVTWMPLQMRRGAATRDPAASLDFGGKHKWIDDMLKV